jgi:hypothetical protein
MHRHPHDLQNRSCSHHPLCLALRASQYETDPSVAALARVAWARRPLTAEGAPMSQQDQSQIETFNPWSIVNLVFHHLAEQGLHPVLGATGDPGEPAAQLLRALGIEPAAEGNRQASQNVRQHLAEIRAAVLGES